MIVLIPWCRLLVVFFGLQEYQSQLSSVSEQGGSQLQCVDGWIMGDETCGSHRSGPQAMNVSQVNLSECMLVD